MIMKFYAIAGLILTISCGCVSIPISKHSREESKRYPPWLSFESQGKENRLIRVSDFCEIIGGGTNNTRTTPIKATDTIDAVDAVKVSGLTPTTVEPNTPPTNRLNLFPFISYEENKDASRFSFLWRVLEVNESKGVKSGYLLFIPFGP
jgi:hypothetical protein